MRLAARNNVYLNYKNMPLFQLLVNLLPITMGIIVKYGFFQKLGFGKEYLDGVKEGIKTRKKCAKVAYFPEHMSNYLAIQWELKIILRPGKEKTCIMYEVLNETY